MPNFYFCVIVNLIQSIQVLSISSYFRWITVFRSTFAYHHEINTGRLWLQDGAYSTTDRSCGHSSTETKGRNYHNKVVTTVSFPLECVLLAESRDGESKYLAVCLQIFRYQYFMPIKYLIPMRCLCFNVPRMPDPVSCSGKTDFFLYLIKTSS